MSRIRPFHFTTKNGTSVLIRSGEESDGKNLLELGKVNMAEDEFTLTQPDELNLTVIQEGEWIRTHVENPARLILVAEVDKKLIGVVDFANGHRRRIAHTGAFGVSVIREWQGQGIGTAMLKALIQWAESNPLIEKICLGVHATNDRAIHIYQKLGFKEEGRRLKELKYGEDKYVDTVLMYLFVK